MSDLPPLDQAQAFVVVGPNDQRGPYALDLLIGEVLAGRLTDATPVWWPGLADWTTMGGHPGTASELARRRAGYVTSEPEPTQMASPEAAPAPAPAPAPSMTSDTFAAVVERSAAVASAVDRVDDVDAAFGAAIDSAAVSGDFVITEDSDPDDGIHAFDGGSGDRLVVVVGTVAGADPTTFRSAVPLDVRIESDRSTDGGQPVGAGSDADQASPTAQPAHGEVVVAAADWGGTASAHLSLYLPVADYVAEDLTVDTVGLAQDVAAVIAAVRERLA